MSILIKGMETPTRCYTCPCADLEFLDCNLMPGTRIEQHKRLDDCPLVPVKPHGRLIDADALVVHKFAGAEHDISITDGGACYRRGWNDAIEAVMENAETIIGEE